MTVKVGFNCICDSMMRIERKTGVQKNPNCYKWAD